MSVVQGLGELYEEEFVKASTGADAVEERDAATKAEARSLLKGLFARLDALSHFHFAPKPVVEDMAVRTEVPALAMEEVAPQVDSFRVLSCCRRSRTFLWRTRRCAPRCPRS